MEQYCITFRKPDQILNEMPFGYYTRFWLDIEFAPNKEWHEIRIGITAGNFINIPAHEILQQ